MRKLKLQVQISIDGFIAGINGEMDWMIWNWDQKLKDYVIAITETMDFIVLGRKLAQGFVPHWASVPQEEGSQKMDNTAKVVFTKTLAKSEWDDTVLAKGDLVHEITKLKKQAGKDIIVYGGANFVSALLKNGLIDELHLFFNPTAIGNGMPIFRELDSIQNFRLIKSTSFECGIVVLNYELKK